MSITDNAVAWAAAIANDDSHGYDQGSRWGPDYDCSSLVISAWKQAGVPLSCTYTGNMRQDMLANDFRDVTAREGGGSRLRDHSVRLRIHRRSAADRLETPDARYPER